MTNDLKDLVRTWYEEGWNLRNKAALEECISDDFVGRDPYQSVIHGRDAMGKYMASMHAAFRDQKVRVDDMVAEDDLVGCRLTLSGGHLGEFMGCAPTRAHVIYPAMALWRIEDGQLSEMWQHWDAFGLKAQMDEANGFKSTVRAQGIELDVGPGPKGNSKTTMAQSERNKDTARRWMDRAWNHGEMTLIDELFVENFWFWDPSGPIATTREAFREWVQVIERGFSRKKRSIVVNDLIAERDKTLLRITFSGQHDGEFLNSRNTGRPVGFGALILVQHAADGRFKRSWQIFDLLKLCQQIGVETRETRTLDGDIRIYTR